MERYNILCIKQNPIWKEPQFQEIRDFYQTELTDGICPEIGLPCIWLNYHDENIFILLGDEIEIISGLSLWFDDVENNEDIYITVENYNAYDSDLFYKIRTGKYDPIEPII